MVEVWINCIEVAEIAFGHPDDPGLVLCAALTLTVDAELCRFQTRL